MLALSWRRMTPDADKAALLQVAFTETWRDLVERTPALSMLPANSSMCKLLRHKLVEGYELGIADVSMLSEYAKAAIPQKRKFRRD